MHLPCKQAYVGALPTGSTILRLESEQREFQAKDVLHSLGEGGLFSNRIPSYGWRAMFHTYVIESLSYPGQIYIGHTADLRQRLADHNAGKCPHTSKFRPWKIKLYVAYETIEQAQHFERYLKSGSGHAFAKRHFWHLTANAKTVDFTAGNSTNAQREAS
jgi:predicted GIY-YIG superfamily endonuclease